jgi:hypothetical protein
MMSHLIRSRGGWLVALMIAVVPAAAPAQVDESYARMAGVLSSPIYLDVDSAKDSHADTAVMLRMAMARQQLMGISQVQPELASVRFEMLRNLETCHLSIENLRRLNQYVPDVEGLAKRTIVAAPGLYKTYNEQDLDKDDQKALGDLAFKAGAEVVGGLVNAYQASTERTAYQAAYAKTRTDAKKAIIGLCQDQYRSSNAAVSLNLTVQVDGSWNNTFAKDWVDLRNDTGRDLTNCTIVVSLAGTNATTGADESDSHVHYLTRWPAGKWLYAPYPSRAANGIATNESVDCIDSVKVTVLSEQSSGTVEHTYTGEALDEDVRRYVTSSLKPKFSGQWFNYTNHTFYDNGFDLSFEGSFSALPASRIDVKITEGTLVKTLYWNLAPGSGLPGKHYFSDPRFNGWNPDRVEVTLSFPKSSYQHVVAWTLK